MTMTVRCGVKVFVVVVAWTRGTLGDARLCFAGNARVGRRGSAQSCFTILGAGRVPREQRGAAHKFQTKPAQSINGKRAEEGVLKPRRQRTWWCRAAQRWAEGRGRPRQTNKGRRMTDRWRMADG